MLKLKDEAEGLPGHQPSPQAPAPCWQEEARACSTGMQDVNGRKSHQRGAVMAAYGVACMSS